MKGKGVNIGLPGDDEDPVMPVSDGSPLWYKKLSDWMRFWKSCQLKAGNAGSYCRWMGSSCCYDHCPARLFEEVEIGLYPEDKIPEPVKDRVRRVDEELQQVSSKVNAVTQKQKKMGNNLVKRVQELEKKIKNEES